jgi:hypothetical protein
MSFEGSNPMDDARWEEILARRREAEAKAWWRDLTGLVAQTDQQLVVIGPRSDATADDLRDLGRVIERWRVEFPQARHIWGLSDLLDGRPPRTPPIYLAVPHPLHRFEERYEPVALVFVAEGTGLRAAAEDLHERIGDLRGKLAWFDHPEDYSLYNR